MRTFLLAISLMLSSFVLWGQDQSSGAASVVGGAYQLPESHCVLPSARAAIVAQLQENSRRLKRQGLLPQRSSSNIVSLQWPLQQASGFNYNSYYGISNYVDQDLTFPNNLLDYNCGSRTYDLTSGYNHRGTDIFLWPFSWHMVNDDQVEVIAAATGTIIFKQDGNSDMNCDFSNPNWNAIYIEHSDGSVAWYGHLKDGSLTTKTVGQSVALGEYLGIVASSGSSTGPHLHFEVWEDDTYTTLVDPWSGACNSMNASSWWTDQKPYRESTLNHLMTNSAYPVFNSCPTPTTINESSSFTQGDQVFFTAFFHDQLSGQISNIRLLTPSMTEWSSWNHTSPSDYNASWWGWSWNFPGTEPTGNWTFELTYQGEVFTHTFSIMAALPVELTAFTAKAEQKAVRLEWSTASEVNSAHFEIQRSGNGHDFYPLGQVQAQGQSSESQTYHYLDTAPLNGENYYRLNQVDLDQSTEYSDIVSVVMEFSNDKSIVRLYPNPVQASKIQVEYLGTAQLQQAQVYNQVGQVVKTIALTGQQQQLDLSGLHTGVYLFAVQLDSGQVFHESVLLY
ncbi:MAG: peptidoglycan DD-metalloendopeptidase family protein [Bacteroidota bacterium]